MSQKPTEKRFEEHIEAHLLNSGYRKLSPEGYDINLCLIPSEVMGFIRDTQPQAFEKLEVQYGADTENKLCQRISQEVTKRGTLDVLRKGIKDRGVEFHLAFFKPASGMNTEHLNLYGQNRLSIVRQLAFSKKYHGTLDVSLFLNGLPIITAELKNSLTGQFVEDAVKQYRTDRKPDEPLFKFKRCLVHFAVGNEMVFMTTRLEGDSTRFLPFNKDTVNPVNQNGFKTAYLWEDILQPDVLLSLLNSYLHIQLVKEKFFDKTRGLIEVEHEVLIFPRYHQLDSVRKMLSALKTEGVGKTYLIQHSAGSGKSNSIAWLAHQLASFYQSENTKERLFDTIIVVTDRKVLDWQLQNTIKQFEQTRGVVHPIDENSAQLKKKLEDGKDIIITTLQKFPRISETIGSLNGKHFAVIVDEAHTSQTGETSKHLKKVLMTNIEDAEKEDQGDEEFDLEDAVLDEIKTRGRQPNISYFAFTATPKNKTLELFGRKNANGKFEAFHTYSMRQAIEEHFILDVLENYTTFERYFKLVKSIPEDNEYEQKKTVRLLTQYVDLQPHAIESKTRIMLDHFLDVTVHAIQGRGRAMLVTRSRLHAVKYYLMFQKVMAEKHLPFKALVAFSGTVKDPDTDKEHTENSLNHLPPKVKIEDAFKTPEYRILIVANKFQTGFDEPLLHTMYVDKKLGGVNAVQTLSRLNRTAKGKKETVVLDFVNEWEAIQKAFQEYYQRVVLEQETDPNKLYDLESKLFAFEIFNQQDVDDHAKICFDPKAKDELLQPVLDKAADRFKNLRDEKGRVDLDRQEDFRTILQSFVRLYGFLSQLMTFQDSGLEKLYAFARNLNKKIRREPGKLPYDVLEAVDLDSFKIKETFRGSISLNQTDSAVKPMGGGERQVKDDAKDFLSHIVELLNETYGTNLTEEDKVDIERIRVKLDANATLREFMQGDNSRENIRYKFNQTVDELLLEFVNTKLELYKKLTDPQVNPMFKSKWFEGYSSTDTQRLLP